MNNQDVAVLTNCLKYKACIECGKLTWCMKLTAKNRIAGQNYCTQCFSRLSKKDYILGVRILESDPE